MGSLVTLGVGHLEVDWGKNSGFTNHSALFLPSDKQLAPYYYAEGVIKEKEAYVRPLESVSRRLDMLGYTLSGCEKQYDEAIEMMPSYYDAPRLSFREYADILKNIDVSKVGLPDDGDYDLGEYVRKVIMQDPEFKRVDQQLASMSEDEGTFFENLIPYVSLRLLAENPVNREVPVIWRIADVVEGGWVGEDDIYEGVMTDDVCLVVTEGSSDSAVLKGSLSHIAPDIVDFFDFVDMSENYPFTGTGNLFRFSQGLARIRIQNRILIVVDNDAAGQACYRRISSLKLPDRMRVTTLPNLEECTRFRTLGPAGPNTEDINGRAVSIELFLDFSALPEVEPIIRWTAYDDTAGQYQGELLNKTEHVSRFLEVTRRGQPYDFKKLAYLWNHLIAVSASQVQQSLDPT